MKVYLVDGTYELFRCFHGAPRATNAAGEEVGAARAFVATMVALLREPDVTHVAVAFDSVVARPGASKRRDTDSLISAQAPLAAEIVRALHMTVWPSGRYQADEMIATGAARYIAHPDVSQVIICSTDNDFNQCVRQDRIVVLDRSRQVITNEAAVKERYGVLPTQIPDLFALVGDRSDGLPGVPGWGEKTAATLLRRYGTLSGIPLDASLWDVKVTGADRLAAEFRARHAETILCRHLSELRTDLPLQQSVHDLAVGQPYWKKLAAICDVIGDHSAIDRLAAARSAG